jgi:hypothetical protein
MARQPHSTIKTDPLEGSDPLSLILGSPPKKQGQETKSPNNDTKRQGQKKEKLTVHVTHDLAERVKNAAYWNPRLTIAAIAERGLARVMEEIEQQNGGPYPPP